MNLIDVFHENCIKVSVEAKNGDEILGEIARLAKSSPALANVEEDKILQMLKDREAMGSTAFGGGVAIPHCRLENVKEFVVGVVTSREGVAFNALDEAPVKLFVFIIAPMLESNEHIKVLSAISQVLRIPGAINELAEAASAEGLYESFLRHCRDEVDTKDRDGKNLFHVFIQSEEIFKDILQIFSAMESCSVQVIESEQSSTYLAKLPLFADFWSDSVHGFNRIIIAMVEKKLTNDTIRRIEHVSGPLDKSKQVMVAIQELFFTNGRIEA
ncbi:MAG: PTS sugar transporter subunit IIA [Planctomycetes bacterium]|nr:PTS sugar transporter subunit IIA [Planctomycetota bacterium]